MPEQPYRRVDTCRSCGSARLGTVLDMGTPFVSDFVDDPQDGLRAPLEMVRCENCTLVQTRHTVDRGRLFREYWYKSGTNESMVAALRDVVHEAQRYVALDRDDAVLDIGSNDGTLLREWPHTVMRYGVEPSDLWQRGLDAGPIQHGFFPEVDLAHEGVFKVITSIAMFYAQDDPNAFVAAIKRSLHPDGVWVVQMQDLDSVLRDRAVDYFCHEHLCLYSPTSFDALLSQHGLEIQDISRNSVNGGSIRFTVGHGNKRQPTVVAPEDWTAFARDVQRLKDQTVTLLANMRDKGNIVLGYAASTKGNTLLQYYGIGPELLPAIAERQEAKWGKRTIGTGIPIVSEEDARAMHPDYFFALAWHFIDGFLQRESVPFIVPLPELAICGCMAEAVA